MDFEYVRNKWNENADEFNQWSELDEIEKVEFAIQCAAHKAAQSIQDSILAAEVAGAILYA